MSTASALDLAVDDAIVVHNSNKVTVRLLPCNVLARVAPVAHQVARFEVELAERLADIESPVAALEPTVEPLVYERDGFAVTLWTYYESVTAREVSPAGYANALQRLHAACEGSMSQRRTSPSASRRLNDWSRAATTPRRSPTRTGSF